MAGLKNPGPDAARAARPQRRSLARRMWRERAMYLLMLPGLVFFVLHKREHFALIPERYFSLLNWSADELDEKHAVVYLAKQRAR